ncbi:MAG: DivIVA domain-containing protein [Oscillospiraceae bacterium]|nr:DivIVA domain-containing protein [Oscillospiraceae bacterium]MCL2249630.1 DivIVA domain-containing protein [Oscillospiraceae bacterium]
MLTPQDITEKGFNKVLVNGYDMGEVDDFLETVTEDYSALYKENAILKGKLKVLVEKVEEYRTTEDAMRMALLTAQRMGDEITSEATKARDEMLLSTEKEIKEKLTETARQVAEEEMRLVAASKETAKFIELSQAILRKHSEFLKKLETAHRTVKPKKGAANPAPAANAKAAPKQVPPPPPPQPAPPPPPPPPPPAPPPKPPRQQEPKQPVAPVADIEFDSIAEEIGNAVEAIALGDNETISQSQNDSPTINTPVAMGEPPQSLFSDEEDSVKLYSPEDDDPMEHTSPRPKFDFDDLKFGANFDTED